MLTEQRRTNTPTTAKYDWQQQILQWTYVIQSEKFYLTEDPTNADYQLKPDHFNFQYQHLAPAPGKTKSGKTKQRSKPTNVIWTHNPDHMVTTMGMYPGKRKRLVALDHGLTALNLHDPIPTYKVEKPQEPKVLLDHLLYILNGDKKHRQYLLNVMCHMVFRPETRLTHGTLISGVSQHQARHRCLG